MEYRKKLIEVALPLEAINAASAREKSIRHGHPSTLHLWWARRPLAACRAVLFASLVDDPSSDPMFGGDEEIEGSKRAELFNLIEELVQWENSNNPRVINKARAEIARCIASRKIETGELKKDQAIPLSSSAEGNGSGGKDGKNAAAKKYTPHEIKQMLASSEAVNHFLANYGPPALDPFCGGGSIPLEAQRLGLRAYGSDLNPVAVLITKALIEIPANFTGMPPVNPEWQKKSREQKAATVWEGARALAEDVRYYGKWMRDEAERRIGHFYPKLMITKDMARDRPDLKDYVGQELAAVAWIWARTVASPNPVCSGAHVPLVRSFWLSTKKRKEVWVEPIVDRGRGSYSLAIRIGKPPKEHRPGVGTVSRNRRICLLSGDSIDAEYIRREACNGHMHTLLMSVVAQGRRERLYLPADTLHAKTASQCNAPANVPDTELVQNARYMTPTIYGMTKHRHLFTNRQLAMLTTFCELVGEAKEKVIAESKGNRDYANAIGTYLAFAISKMADRGSTLCTWFTDRDSTRNTFARQALSMSWDFAELNPLLDGTGSFLGAVQWTAESLEQLHSEVPGIVQQANAMAETYVGKTALVSTDPPYYDNVPYADLADFFYVWLRFCLQPIYPELLSTILVPKAEELVAEPTRQGGRDEARMFFEDGMKRVFCRLQEASDPNYPTTVYYAFKQMEENDEEDTDIDSKCARSSTGWETFLQGLADTGWQVMGTWPMRTELGNRMRNLESNALASSIVLVCRPRATDSGNTSRREFLVAVKKELPEALRNLQQGNIAPVDLAQAAIGPGMAVFTRYSKVMETDGSPMTVRTALGLINQALDEVLAEQEGEFDTDTRWALAWFEQFGMEEGPFGVAETLSKAKNTAVSGLVEAGVAKARGGKVQLLKRAELPDDWEPSKDSRLTIWEVTQHLIRTLEQEGESGAAALLHKLGGMGEIARDLAYRLYTICERKKWAEEALAYNGLVIAWPELTRLAQAERSKAAPTQTKMF